MQGPKALLDLKKYKAAVVFFKWTKLPQYEIRITINRHILIYFATFMNLQLLVFLGYQRPKLFYKFTDPLNKAWGPSASQLSNKI